MATAIVAGGSCNQSSTLHLCLAWQAEPKRRATRPETRKDDCGKRRRPFPWFWVRWVPTHPEAARPRIERKIAAFMGGRQTAPGAPPLRRACAVSVLAATVDGKGDPGAPSARQIVQCRLVLRSPSLPTRFPARRRNPPSNYSSPRRSRRASRVKKKTASPCGKKNKTESKFLPRGKSPPPQKNAMRARHAVRDSARISFDKRKIIGERKQNKTGQFLQLPSERTKSKPPRTRRRTGDRRR